MDRWEPYIQATQAPVPEAAGKSVLDRFHVMGHVGKAVDQVHMQEHRELMAVRRRGAHWQYVRVALQPAARAGAAARGIQYMDAPGFGSRSGVGLKKSVPRIWHSFCRSSGWRL